MVLWGANVPAARYIQAEERFICAVQMLHAKQEAVVQHCTNCSDAQRHLCYGRPTGAPRSPVAPSAPQGMDPRGAAPAGCAVSPRGGHGAARRTRKGPGASFPRPLERGRRCVTRYAAPLTG